MTLLGWKIHFSVERVAKPEPPQHITATWNAATAGSVITFSGVSSTTATGVSSTTATGVSSTTATARPGLTGSMSGSYIMIGDQVLNEKVLSRLIALLPPEPPDPEKDRLQLAMEEAIKELS